MVMVMVLILKVMVTMVMVMLVTMVMGVRSVGASAWLVSCLASQQNEFCLSILILCADTTF